MTVLAALPIAADALPFAAIEALLGDSARAAVLPVPADDAPAAARMTAGLGVGEAIAEDVRLVVATSGSTGAPKGAQHTASTLRASVTGSAAALGGTGRWLLALPPHHIAGLNVVLRSLAAGVAPAVLDVSRGFDVDAFVDAARRTAPRYVSLVPTQLVKLVAAGRAGVLARFDAVLLGGAAAPSPAVEAVVAAGAHIVLTYGMSETVGGCVYDGRALPGTRVDVRDGRILLGGAVVAHGYRGVPEHPAFARPGWFRTDDVGELAADGTLRILGRADAAISTGGLTVLPEVVEHVVAAVAGVRECAAFGLPDPRLGELVAVAVVGPADDGALRAAITAATTAELGREAAPRAVFVVDALPLRGPGKVDRAALVERFTAR